jgi:hypothetical protein
MALNGGECADPWQQGSNVNPIKRKGCNLDIQDSANYALSTVPGSDIYAVGVVGMIKY